MPAPDPTHSAAPDPATLTGAEPAVTGSLADPAATTGGPGEGTVAAVPPVSAPRYQLGDEIARGGMGVVYRATDTAFGREVAVKVLLDKYAPTSGTARRFADEARITGQLQHPNIPAVFDLGTLPDGRPFLAMKLIKGDTLDDLLKARPNPSVDRGRFVAAFEQVCQAVAYAHAHQVIHRDLKPANVMVGNYGEVQVMDWGLAKVLGSRDADATDPDETTSPTAIHSIRESDDLFTQAGSVLGTPAFMPPEQAVGAIHKVDARSDVFGLGAILAVILTGTPPFAASSVETTRIQAAQGNVEECFARLDACGAEPELVSLCKRCLSKKPGDRPADAGQVAKAVAALRAAADERARQAELDRVKAEGDKATAEAKAEEQRKRRRVQLALAGLVFLVAVGGGIAAVQVQRQREQDRIATERETRAAAIVDSLGGADTPGVPRIVEDLADLRDLARPKLVERLANAKPGSKEHLHASLALLPGDPAQVESIRQRLLTATPAEIVVIRQSLTPHAAEVNPRLWAVAEDPAAAMGRRLRALAALAGLDPQSERWTPLAGPLAQRLVAESPLLVGEWLKVFQPVRLKLLTPLAAIYRVPLSAGPDADLKQTLVEFERKAVAVSWLAEYAIDQPARLADYLMAADADQWAVLWPPFARVSDQGVPAFLGELAKTLPADVPSSDPQREVLAKRQTNAAVALLRLNQPATVWPLLKHSSDPRVRSYLIHRLFPLGASPEAIIRRLDEEPDLSARRALLLAVGEFDDATLPAASRAALLPRVQRMYRDDPDPGLHAASEWLLRTWEQAAWLTRVNEEWAKDGGQRGKRLDAIKKQLADRAVSAPPQWYVNTQGQTLVVIPGPLQFSMGSPATEVDRQDSESQHARRIGRTYAIASKLITVEQYRTSDKSLKLPDKYATVAHLPAVTITWYQAAAYCNWLSKEEGMAPDQWCYEIKGEVTRLKKDYLSLAGYRLPTEAEMEYAMRAGTLTSRYFGETEDLLPKYARYMKNARQLPSPVGSLKPNDLGLFDAVGNVYSWCQETYKDYPPVKGEETARDTEDALEIVSTTKRVLRGGSWDEQASNLRSSLRLYYEPTIQTYSFGFRVARTIIP